MSPRRSRPTLAARGKSRLIVPADIDPAWLPGDDRLRARRRALLSRARSQSEGVLTGCSLAIATTGTIVLRHGRRRGPPRADPDPRLPPLRRPRRSDRRDGAGGASRLAASGRARHHHLRSVRHRRHRDDADPRRARTANAGRHRRRRADRTLTVKSGKLQIAKLRRTSANVQLPSQTLRNDQVPTLGRSVTASPPLELWSWSLGSSLTSTRLGPVDLLPRRERVLHALRAPAPAAGSDAAAPCSIEFLRT